MSLSTIVIAAAVVLIGVFLYRSNRSGQESALDARVIVQLKQAGSDLGKPHAIDFFLYFPCEASANDAAQQLRADGDTVAVKLASESGTEWSLQIARTMVPAVAALVEIRKQFEGVAQSLGGVYDGWGAGVVR